MHLIAAIGIGLALFVSYLLISLGIMLIRHTLTEHSWIEWERVSEEERGDVALLKEVRHHRTSRTDILWGSERDRAYKSLQNLFRAEHERKEKLEANKRALSEVTEDWMREMIQKDILALAPREEYLADVWEAQNHLENIEEREILLASQQEQGISFLELKKAWTSRSCDTPQIS